MLFAKTRGMALLTAVLFITFAVRNIPPVARTWRQLSSLKLLALLAALAAATVEEAVFLSYHFCPGAGPDVGGRDGRVAFYSNGRCRMKAHAKTLRAPRFFFASLRKLFSDEEKTVYAAVRLGSRFCPWPHMSFHLKISSNLTVIFVAGSTASPVVYTFTCISGVKTAIDCSIGWTNQHDCTPASK